MISSFLNGIRNFSPWITFYITVSSACLFFLMGIHAAKYLIFLFAILSIVLTYQNSDYLKVSRPLLSFLFPFVPWFISVIILILVHGIDGFSYAYNAMLIMTLVFLGIQKITFTRNGLICILASFLVCMSIAIIAHVLYLGFIDSGVFSVNKNKVAGVITFLTISCLASFHFDRKLYPTNQRIYIAFCIVVSLVSIVLLEARTALLAFPALAITCLLSNRKEDKKFAIIATLIFIALVFCFFLTGRIQQGIENLQSYQEGNSSTSWGIRIELWKFAIYGFIEQPLFGWGDKPFAAIASSGCAFNVPSFGVFLPHFHSDFFQTLATGGLVGIIGWLISLVLLLKDSWKDSTRLALLASIAAMGLADRYWAHWITFFPFVTLWLMLYLSSRKTETSYEKAYCLRNPPCL